MTALVLDPHGDDAALFAAYSCMSDDTHLLVTHPTVPQAEIWAAARELGISAVTIDADEASRRRNLLLAVEPTVVFAPEINPDGHLEHNQVGLFAVDFFGRHKVEFYATYAPRGTRTRTSRQVIPEPWMIAKKLRALACFESQIRQESTRPWFFNLLDMREWVA